MAEQEVIKHTKKIYKIWTSQEHNIWYKVKEFFLEIFIIVFAVSLSIWLHEKSEHAHQQKEVKEFLLGLRADLTRDIKEMTEDKKSYVNQGNAFRYTTSVQKGQTLADDSLSKYKSYFFNTTLLQLNNGRFEGFKASGKIGLIEDKNIQNEIMDVYQESLPALLASAEVYIRRKNQFIDFMIKHQKRTSGASTNISSILLTDEAQNLSLFLSDTDEIVDRYDVCIDKMNGIIGNIDRKYATDK